MENVEKQARASAERRSNEMALRALEAERTKRLEAEKLLALERSYSAQLLSKHNLLLFTMARH